jgi:hypothetical protein
MQCGKGSKGSLSRTNSCVSWTLANLVGGCRLDQSLNSQGHGLFQSCA